MVEAAIFSIAENRAILDSTLADWLDSD